MEPARQTRSFPALLSLLAGGCAAAICAAWLAKSWDGGLRFAMPLPDDLMEYDALQANVLLATLFMLAVPPLALTSLAAGLAGRRQRTAKAGLLLAAAAAIGYLLVLRSAFTF